MTARDVTSTPHGAPKGLRLKYGRAVAIIHALDVDLDSRVLVVGDPDNASYEWAIEKNGKVERHSDAGYGIPEVAMRDGLIEYYGAPKTLQSAGVRSSDLLHGLHYALAYLGLDEVARVSVHNKIKELEAGEGRANSLLSIREEELSVAREQLACAINDVAELTIELDKAQSASDARDAGRYRKLKALLDNEEVTAGLHEAFMAGPDAMDAALDAELATADSTSKPEILDDGFGNQWPMCRADCALQIVRPGKVQCEADDCPHRTETPSYYP